MVKVADNVRKQIYVAIVYAATFLLFSGRSGEHGRNH